MRAPRFQPTQLVVSSFAAVILVGTVLLALPLAARSGRAVPLVDALFTAASATCVTGLTAVDVGTTFSFFGQLVILVCIQVGGLGLMTFTTVFAVAMGHRVAIADRVAVQESFHHTATAEIARLIRYVAGATFLTEGLGAAVLVAYWLATDRFAGLGETVYQAVFHAVSAFCNAGFSLLADNLISFQRDPVVQLVVTSLIVAGGLGFLVGFEVKQYIGGVLGVRRDPATAGRLVRLSVHSKLVLLTTAGLLGIGTVSYYVLERGGVFGHLPAWEAWMNAYFAAVTPRTAGFNTVNLADMGGPALLCTMILMMIGASPGSTGGGVKTSTFSLLVATAISRWRGYRRLHLFHRTVPQESLDKASSVVVAALALVIVAASALMATEAAGMSVRESQARFLPVLFETISAFGTVGLSMGITPLLSDAGKLILVAVMFMGRTGPLTLALAISLRARRVQYRYAEDNVMVG